MIQNKFHWASFFAGPAMIAVGIVLGVLLSKGTTPAEAQVITPPTTAGWAISSSNDRMCWVISPQGKLFQVFREDRQNTLQVISSVNLY